MLLGPTLEAKSGVSLSRQVLPKKLPEARAPTLPPAYLSRSPPFPPMVGVTADLLLTAPTFMAQLGPLPVYVHRQAPLLVRVVIWLLPKVRNRRAPELNPRSRILGHPLAKKVLVAAFPAMVSRPFPSRLVSATPVSPGEIMLTDIPTHGLVKLIIRPCLLAMAKPVSIRLIPLDPSELIWLLVPIRI